MFKFKIFLFLLILPISYFFYHIIGFDRGINAYYEKISILNHKKLNQKQLISEINLYKQKIQLLDPENTDLDYLEEKSFETLGKTDKDSYAIIYNNQ
tara:strand:- start:165 stop:455 length:291 start_codon:yes stop_codon:yes gene_type:complete